MISPTNIPNQGISYIENLFIRFRKIDLSMKDFDKSLKDLQIEIDKFNELLDKKNSIQKQNDRRK